MSGWIIAAIVVLVLFAVGAVFCAPFSPVHKKLESSRSSAVVQTIGKK